MYPCFGSGNKEVMSGNDTEANVNKFPREHLRRNVFRRVEVGRTEEKGEEIFSPRAARPSRCLARGFSLLCHPFPGGSLSNRLCVDMWPIPLEVGKWGMFLPTGLGEGVIHSANTNKAHYFSRTSGSGWLWWANFLYPRSNWSALERYSCRDIRFVGISASYQVQLTFKGVVTAEHTWAGYSAVQVQRKNAVHAIIPFCWSDVS